MKFGRMKTKQKVKGGEGNRILYANLKEMHGHENNFNMCNYKALKMTSTQCREKWVLYYFI